jgi:hypothetical protein
MEYIRAQESVVAPAAPDLTALLYE